MTHRNVRGERGVVRGHSLRGVFVLLVVATALLVVFVPAGGAWVNAPGAPSAVDGTGTEINVPIFPMLGASGFHYFYSGVPGIRAMGFVAAQGPPPSALCRSLMSAHGSPTSIWASIVAASPRSRGLTGR